LLAYFVYLTNFRQSPVRLIDFLLFTGSLCTFAHAEILYIGHVCVHFECETSAAFCRRFLVLFHSVFKVLPFG
jgi:hypothetical protein